MANCANCGLDPDDYINAGELRQVPCGQLLCDDCRFEHRQCSGCAQELAYEAADYNYDKWRDECFQQTT